MKNVCIVVRNKRDPYYGEEFGPAASALADGGFPADKIFLIDGADAHEFAQTVIECKNFFDNTFVLAADAELDALRGKLCELVKCPPSAGVALEAGAKHFFCLPFGGAGAALVRGEVIPYLKTKYEVAAGSAFVRAVGVPADLLEKVIGEAKAQAQGMEIVTSCLHGDCRIEIVYGNAPKTQVDEVMRIFASGLKEYVYAIDDTPLNKRVYDLLLLRKQRLSVAESFTGGGVASSLIEVPGMSQTLFESIVAYDNGSKMRRLGVLQQTLDTQGAVSDETAYEMAAGLLATGNCTVALATTGIAGPQSDNTNKPVGLCYIAAGTKEAVYVYKYLFKGTREEITKRAIFQALFLLYKQIV